jgi:C-terminal processing protease CtpA/Prc
MSATRGSLSRSIVGIVFGGLALVAFAGTGSCWAQNTTPQTRQAGAAGQSQGQPQNANPNAGAAAQGDQRGAGAQAGQQAGAQAGQQAGAQAGQADRQTSGSGRANSADLRQNRASRDNEQEDAAWLGVFLSQRENERGATITQVYPAGPGARAGLQPGDVIQQINGQQVSNSSELVSVLEQLHPGDKAEISVLRSDEPTKLTAKLGSRNSYVSHNQQTNRFSGRDSQYDESEDQHNFPLHAMEL